MKNERMIMSGEWWRNSRCLNQATRSPRPGFEPITSRTRDIRPNASHKTTTNVVVFYQSRLVNVAIEDAASGSPWQLQTESCVVKQRDATTSPDTVEHNTCAPWRRTEAARILETFLLLFYRPGNNNFDLANECKPDFFLQYFLIYIALSSVLT